MAENTETENKPVKRTVLDVDDIISVAPVLANHRKFVKWLMRVLETPYTQNISTPRGHHS